MTRANRNLAGPVPSGQEVFKLSRARSSRVKRFSNLTGRVESGQEVSKSHGSGRIGLGGFQNLAAQVGSGQVRLDQVKMSQNFGGWSGRIRT